MSSTIGSYSNMWMDDTGILPWQPEFQNAIEKHTRAQWEALKKDKSMARWNEMAEKMMFPDGMPHTMAISPPMNAFDARAAIKRHENEIKHVEEKLAKLKFELFILNQGLEQVMEEGDLDVSKLIEEANNACDQL